MWIRTIPRVHVLSQELCHSVGPEKGRYFATTPGRPVNLRFQKDPNQFLKQFGRDLTEEARAGRLDPVIGRDETIQRCLQVLARRTKNNPILIGEAGVGKTAIAEGLAQYIISGQV
jgi:ATP-dependent Clp protease ATP-binding subunit ClpA